MGKGGGVGADEAESKDGGMGADEDLSENIVDADKSE